MYQKPLLERFGTLREITRAGFIGAGDGLIFTSVPGDVGDVGCDAFGGVTCPADSRS